MVNFQNYRESFANFRIKTLVIGFSCQKVAEGILVKLLKFIKNILTSVHTQTHMKGTTIKTGKIDMKLSTASSME